MTLETRFYIFRVLHVDYSFMIAMKHMIFMNVSFLQGKGYWNKFQADFWMNNFFSPFNFILQL